MNTICDFSCNSIEKFNLFGEYLKKMCSIPYVYDKLFCLGNGEEFRHLTLHE